jgi:hypothetical protein
VTTTRAYGIVLMLSFTWLGCSAPQQATPAAAGPETPKAHMNMLQLMRAFPFPHSNVLFDAQSRDPEGEEKKQSMSYSVYRWQDSDTYAGWQGVENSALALSEMAPLLLIPRQCSNGKPAPVDQADWKAAVQGLVETGEAGQKAALTKSVDEMLNFGEKLANACAACHDKYRDVDLSGGERCQVKAE